MSGLLHQALTQPAPPLHSLVRRYSLAAITTGLAILVLLPLRSMLFMGYEPPLLLAVAISALLGGVGPGLLAVLLTAIAAELWLVAPFGGVVPELVRQVLYLACGVPLALLGGATRRARAWAQLEDIALRESEARLRASDERYRAFLKQTAEAIWRYELERPLDVTRPEDEQIDHLYAYAYLAECNEATGRMRGLTDWQAIVGARLGEHLPRTDSQNVMHLRAFIRSGYRLLEAESQERDRTGTTRYFLANLLGIVEDGALRRVWGSQRNITKRKEAEQALRQSEERYRALVDAASQVVWSWDPRTKTGDLAAAHRWWEDITGQSREEQTNGGLGWLEVLHPDDRERIRAAWDAMLQGSRYHVEYRVRGRDGDYRHIWTRMVPIRDADGNIRELVGMSLETTAKHRAEAALRASEARLRRVLESDMIGIGFWNGERVTEANDALLRLLGYERAEVEAGLLDYRSLSPPHGDADRPGITELMARRSAGPYETELVRKDGSRVSVLVGGAMIEGDAEGLVFFVLDLTERRRAEEQLRAAQRLETVGRLAGGIAHETNNQMSIVLGATHFLLQHEDLPPDVREDVDQIRKAAEHTGNITRQLLAFSRRQILQPQQLDVNYELRSLEPVIRRTLGAQIELAMHLAPELGLVRVDPGQLSQVVLNLVLNARDAMPDRGTLTIATTKVTLGTGATSALGESIPPGTYVVLSVSDTGVGIDRETLSRIFEPFFTTKPIGAGTGLGLSTVHGIVRQSSGYVAVESAPGRGTTFRVFLRHAAPEPKPRRSPTLDAAPRGSATILMVDDQPQVLAMLARALRKEGYTVLEATTAADALSAASSTDLKLDLLVTDLVMPQISGNELAGQIARLRPDLPVLYTSGHADEEMRQRGLLDVAQPFLQKPYSPEVLIERIRYLLAERKPT
jgi:two-component system cell cycle sensor histidine kinase/response regulator CckA